MIVSIIILFLVSFFFSGSETALTVANRTKFQTAGRMVTEKLKDFQNY